MKKWADYLISQVSYDEKHLISRAKRHQELEEGITKGDFVDRIKISSDINNGLTYITIYDRISTWKKGNQIRFYRLDGEPYLRIDKNKVNQDYLGDILTFEAPKTQKLQSEAEEATPEQLARLEELENRVKVLEEENVSQSNALYEAWNSLDARIDILAENKTDV